VHAGEGINASADARDRERLNSQRAAGVLRADIVPHDQIADSPDTLHDILRWAKTGADLA
jgi:hypothetical protein